MRRYLIFLIVTFIIVLVSAWIIWPQNPGVHIGSVNKDFKTQLGLDLVGGVQALLEADLPASEVIDPDAMSAAVRIVDNRVNGLGVTEAVVQQAGDRRILVELPGETDPEKALQALKQTGLLEFVDMSSVSANEVYSLLQNQTPIVTDFTKDTLGTTSPDETIYKTIMTGSVLEDAQVNAGQTGGFEVVFKLNSQGAEIFKNYTSQNIGQILAIVLDNKIISAPTVQTVIPDGSGRITGSFTYEEANTLAVQLRYGALPIPLKIVESRTVGATLGQDSLQKSLAAGLIGFVVVFLFMAIYYRVPGILADLAIVIYALIAFAIFRYIPVTLTLAGIAGFLLSTGSALDANILIFERMKEELRSGRTIAQSIDQGWNRAWPSIRDSNIAILITCGILFWFGSQFGATIVKGFAITLAIGVVVSLFVSVVTTRGLLGLIFNNIVPKNLSKWFGI